MQYGCQLVELIAGAYESITITCKSDVATERGEKKEVGNI